MEPHIHTTTCPGQCWCSALCRSDLPVSPLLSPLTLQNPTVIGWRWGRPSISRCGDGVARDLNSSSRSHSPPFHLLWGFLVLGGGRSCLLQDSVPPSVEWTVFTQVWDLWSDSGLGFGVPLLLLLQFSPHFHPRDWQGSGIPHQGGAYRKPSPAASCDLDATGNPRTGPLI